MSCDEKFNFFCSTPVQSGSVCPQDYYSYKGDCIYASRVAATVLDSKHKCGERGGILLPVKNKGLYEFIQKFSLKLQFPEFHNGLNFTSGEFSDKTVYSAELFDYNGEHSKIGDFPCTVFKKGIGYKVRGNNCSILHFYCLWKGNFYNHLINKAFVIHS